MIIKAPIYLVFTLTIPVVDNELPMRGWIRSLNLAHLIVSPQICLLIAQSRIFIEELKSNNFLLLSVKLIDPIRQHLIVLGISLILFVLVYFTSKSDQAPKYHILFAYFGFIVCISWIYAIANEVVNMLDAIRVIFNLSKFMIGLTIGAWGNSIGGRILIFS
ncbi:Na+/Ca2+ exchanger-like protein [Sarcoptes scabiei]|uniref:Na+/Ca2+ exchanger-like protein n=1 Tax=Sarcoptes scabiei TaxID=52283 RepID=A0A132A509_SARSC|nr:Na+/Ca2+ exchanger-like protein [Sarcoptes scabiei]